MITVAAGILMQDGHILICQRRQGGAFPLRWEFPGGKLESGEDAASCLRRELREELDIDAEIGSVLATTHYTYPNGFEVELFFLHVTHYAGRLINRAFEQIQWVEPGQLPQYDFLEADRPLVARLASGELI